jgi:hypothetical protein
VERFLRAARSVLSSQSQTLANSSVANVSSKSLKFSYAGLYRAARQGVTPPPPTKNPPDTVTSTSLTPTLANSSAQRLLEIPEIFLCVVLSASCQHRTQIHSAVSPLNPSRPRDSQLLCPDASSKSLKFFYVWFDRCHATTAHTCTLTSTSLTPTRAASLSNRLLETPEIFLREVSRRRRPHILLTL